MKKILFWIFVLAFAYFFLLPTVIKQKQDEFKAAGAGANSVLDFLHPNQNEDR